MAKRHIPSPFAPLSSVLFLAYGAAALQSSTPAQGLVRIDREAEDASRLYWMRLENHGDVEYTGLLRIGGQQMKAVVDTGSFELLVFGVQCVMCGSTELLYNGTRSQEYYDTGFEGDHAFGSGTTKGKEVVDRVQIGALHIDTQVFWEVTDANMPILYGSPFQVILGVGPPSSAAKMAERKVADVHKELEAFRRSGKNVTRNITSIVHHYEERVQHAKNTTSVVENLHVANMAMCLHKESGSDGYFIWGDRRPLEMPNKFTKLDVVGDMYWSLNLSHVHLDGAQVDADASEDMKRAAESKYVGCLHGNCSAVIDSGTSLIVAPARMATKIHMAVAEWVEAGGTCDDLSKLPDIKFQLNGVDFSLPPEAYVGQMDGEIEEEMRDYMPRFVSTRQHELITNLGCKPLVMSMDAHSQFGELWIFGMPFFRKYFTGFHLQQYLGKLSMPQAKAMSFSEADSRCRPARAPGANRTNTVRNRAVQLKIDSRKLRISAVAGQVREIRRKSLFNVPVHIRI